MIFDKFLAKFLFDRKLSVNRIIYIIGVLHLSIYFILFKLVFFNKANSFAVLMIVLAVFFFAFLYRIFILKKYLKELSQQL